MSNLDFDGQAVAFERRAGLPVSASRKVAQAVLGLAEPGTLLDLGAGTGVIGRDLAASHPSYVAIDRSVSMLAVFCASMPKSTDARLVAADADRPWPLRSSSIATVFSSRAVHLLRPGHVLGELRRVSRSEGFVLILGSVRRPRQCVRESLRRRMRELLQEQGIDGRGGRKGRRRLMERLREMGGEPLSSVRAAEWPVEERAADSLRSWGAKNGLAGQAVAPKIRLDVLDRLESWARERFGDLEAVMQSKDHYVLEAVRFPCGIGDVPSYESRP